MWKGALKSHFLPPHWSSGETETQRSESLQKSYSREPKPWLKASGDQIATLPTTERGIFKWIVRGKISCLLNRTPNFRYSDIKGIKGWVTWGEESPFSEESFSICKYSTWPPMLSSPPVYTVRMAAKSRFSMTCTNSIKELFKDDFVLLICRKGFWNRMCPLCLRKLSGRTGLDKF